MDWRRPYLVMRILAVYNLADLEPGDTALSLGLLAGALGPSTTLPGFLGLDPARSDAPDPAHGEPR